ncbi:hypothetical protein [Rhodococcus sp. B50]|jgi:hypothetical protein|uniref:hypothetical protein n=1 Tax=Rhodococcus sp. B50 TaxID=2682847 RepID=UPI001BD2866E|nr:hypothetical protein [Rhodococcus sp. B50]MBS9371575.1 hypothetical protein [Rhodococcus sp. B50]
MATPEPQTYTAPYVVVDSPGGLHKTNALVTILEDGSLVVGGTAETNAKRVDMLAEKISQDG